MHPPAALKLSLGPVAHPPELRDQVMRRISHKAIFFRTSHSATAMSGGF
jgi:hypothetical protein